MIRATIMLLLWASLMLSGCAGIGPSTVSRDRFDYTEAISDSWKHQMLLNMIKIRYGDTPIFLDVSSVISQYQITGQLNLGGTFNNNPWSTSQLLGGSGTYVDRPTITYSPILGDKFARSQMAWILPWDFMLPKGLPLMHYRSADSFRDCRKSSRANFLIFFGGHLPLLF